MYVCMYVCMNVYGNLDMVCSRSYMTHLMLLEQLAHASEQEVQRCEPPDRRLTVAVCYYNRSISKPNSDTIKLLWDRKLFTQRPCGEHVDRVRSTLPHAPPLQTLLRLRYAHYRSPSVRPHDRVRSEIILKIQQYC